MNKHREHTGWHKPNYWSYLVGDTPGYNPTDCVECGQTFNGKPPRGRTQNYCSAACAHKAFERKRDTTGVEKQCIRCGVSFMASKAKRNTRKFCSWQCRTRHNDEKANTSLECQICGKPVKRWGSKVFSTVTCSNKCMGLAKRKEWPTSGNFAAVRKWLGRFGRMTHCEKCGYSAEPAILVVHHNDRNRKNNTRENLAILCPNCHALEHLSENKNGWNHSNPESTVKRQRIADKNKMDKNRNYVRA